MSSKLAYKAVDRKMWALMLQAGHVLDIEKGGLFDSRSGAVNVWASPDDKPDGWDIVTITRGALSFPRSFVGSVYTEYDENELQDMHFSLVDLDPENVVFLVVDATPYDRWEITGKNRPDEQEQLNKEMEWVKTRIDKLFEMAKANYEFEDVESIYCKFCDKRIKVVLVNDFISHLIEEHNVSVENVVIGDGVQIDTNIGLVEI